ncbi:hypothetical protein IE53DRAFT_365941 [Violaceomyces palustris]|uniref:Uncharacterized protein n=1 Tax=Violaceomyces palustris TaxID=1673888 RepID=A0ACD0P7B3_9BASI|nr:hypothetical protein IE53DRAFT_365941 [Violaceomyces palustris]
MDNGFTLPQRMPSPSIYNPANVASTSADHERQEIVHPPGYSSAFSGEDAANPPIPIPRPSNSLLRPEILAPHGPIRFPTPFSGNDQHQPASSPPQFPIPSVPQPQRTTLTDQSRLSTSIPHRVRHTHPDLDEVKKGGGARESGERIHQNFARHQMPIPSIVIDQVSNDQNAWPDPPPASVLNAEGMANLAQAQSSTPVDFGNSPGPNQAGDFQAKYQQGLPPFPSATFHVSNDLGQESMQPFQEFPQSWPYSGIPLASYSFPSPYDHPQAAFTYEQWLQELALRQGVESSAAEFQTLQRDMSERFNRKGPVQAELEREDFERARLEGLVESEWEAIRRRTRKPVKEMSLSEYEELNYLEGRIWGIRDRIELENQARTGAFPPHLRAYQGVHGWSPAGLQDLETCRQTPSKFIPPNNQKRAFCWRSSRSRWKKVVDVPRPGFQASHVPTPYGIPEYLWSWDMLLRSAGSGTY